MPDDINYFSGSGWAVKINVTFITVAHLVLYLQFLIINNTPILEEIKNLDFHILGSLM